MNRNVLFASWASAAVAGTFWACSASITAPDLGFEDGGGTDGSMNGGDGGRGGDSGGGSDSAMTGDSAEAGEKATCGATATYDLCNACCDMFHPGGGDVIPNVAYDCTCMKGSAAILARECATPCKTTYCNDAGISAPDAGSSCEICLGKALAGDAGDASAGVGSRPGDCRGPAISACVADPNCIAYEKCVQAADCNSKP